MVLLYSCMFLLRTVFSFISEYLYLMQHSYPSYFNVFDNSDWGHNGVGLCWFSFLLRLGHIFLILCWVLLDCILGIMSILLWNFRFCSSDEVHFTRSVLPSLSGSSNVSSFSKALQCAALNLSMYIAQEWMWDLCWFIHRIRRSFLLLSSLWDYLCSSAHRDLVLVLWSERQFCLLCCCCYCSFNLGNPWINAGKKVAEKPQINSKFTSVRIASSRFDFPSYTVCFWLFFESLGSCFLYYIQSF